MTEPVPDTWNSRELPVLRAAAMHRIENPVGPGITIGQISEETGIEFPQVVGAVRALEDAGLVGATWQMGGYNSRVDRMNAEARRYVGQWPTSESALDRILAALETIAENTDDDETRTNARKFGAWLKASATTVGIGVATAAITGQLPH